MSATPGGTVSGSGVAVHPLMRPASAGHRPRASSKPSPSVSLPFGFVPSSASAASVRPS